MLNGLGVEDMWPGDQVGEGCEHKTLRAVTTRSSCSATGLAIMNSTCAAVPKTLGPTHLRDPRLVRRRNRRTNRGRLLDLRQNIVNSRILLCWARSPRVLSRISSFSRPATPTPFAGVLHVPVALKPMTPPASSSPEHRPCVRVSLPSSRRPTLCFIRASLSPLPI